MARFLATSLREWRLGAHVVDRPRRAGLGCGGRSTRQKRRGGRRRPGGDRDARVATLTARTPRAPRVACAGCPSRWPRPPLAAGLARRRRSCPGARLSHRRGGRRFAVSPSWIRSPCRRARGAPPGSRPSLRVGGVVVGCGSVGCCSLAAPGASGPDRRRRRTARRRRSRRGRCVARGRRPSCRGRSRAVCLVEQARRIAERAGLVERVPTHRRSVARSCSGSTDVFDQRERTVLDLDSNAAATNREIGRGPVHQQQDGERPRLADPHEARGVVTRRGQCRRPTSPLIGDRAGARTRRGDTERPWVHRPSVPPSGRRIFDSGWTSCSTKYRASLHDSLNGLTEEEARLRLVPSKTTLLGLLEARHLRRRGVVRPGHQRPVACGDRHSRHRRHRSFTLNDGDTIASVQDAHRSRCEASRRTLTGLDLDTVVHGRGERTVWALQLQVLRELAEHAGHADILREQALARRRTYDDRAVTAERAVR